MRLRWDDRLLVVLGLIAAPLAQATPAQAHSTADVMPSRWNATSAPWRFTPEVGNEFRPAVRAAANAWGNLGRNFSFPENTPDAADFAANTVCGSTGVNTIHREFIDGDPTDPNVNDTLANARTCVTNGIATRFAITIDNGNTFDLNVDTAATTSNPDLVSVMVHEFGHATGRTGGVNNGHYLATDGACAAGVGVATMCPSYSGGRAFRTLEPHDVHTFSSVYTGTNSYCGFTVYGGIRTKYVANGGSTGGFGCPTVEEYDVNDGGRREDFVNGNITFLPGVGVFSVKNAIASRWRAIGATGWGFPMIDETLLPDGVGYHNHFRRPGVATSCGQQNDRSIYWHPNTGAHAVEGEIRKRWCALGWEGGVGYPSTSESVTPDGAGRYNHFLKIGQAATCSTGGNASIYYHPQVGAHLVKGGIRQRWCAIGWEGGVVGYPTTSETATPVRTGAYNHFKKFNSTGTTAQYDASIYWSPAYGAWEVYGNLRSKWSALGWEGGVLGFPRAARSNVSTGVRQLFEFGGVYASSTSSVATARALWGPVHGRYVTEGGPTSSLGFPVTDVYTPLAGGAGDQQADFQTGSIRYVAATNSTVVCPVRC